MLAESTSDELLVALVDRPSERAEVEYKGWLAIETAETRAKLAKHLCALANYGGGWLVFGISDHGAHDEPHPGDLSIYSHDTINAIVKTYLTPAFECEVVNVRSGVTSKLYPVVRVPSHESVPICAKRNGPKTDSKIEGIRQGVHYTRAPGPESIPVDSSELWRSIIHRCVVNEREALLSSIGRLFDRPIETQTAEDVDRLLNEGIALWEASQLDSGWRADPHTNRCAFAFHMLDESNRSLPPVPLGQLERAIRDASFGARTESDLGWPLFGVTGLSEQPKVDLFDGDVEGYRAILIHENGVYLDCPAVWRIAANGRGIEVRGYHEDSAWLTSAVESRGGSWPPATYFSPRLQQRRVYQFVAFVRLLGLQLEGVARVKIGIDFHGLAERTIRDPLPGVYYNPDRQAAVDQRRVRIETSLEALAGQEGSAEATARLLGPMGRLFDGWEITAAAISQTLRDGS